MSFTTSMVWSILLGCREPTTVTKSTVETILDRDADGYPAGEDCNDGNSAINPDAAESCDGVDNNCDGQIDENVVFPYYADTDQDGFGDPNAMLYACSIPAGYVPFGNDCDDNSDAVYPGALEICNAIDDNCDGNIDEDLVEGLYYDADGDGHGDPNQPSEDCQVGEGYVLYGDDCDDSNPNIYPFAVEDCDGIDNDCNDIIDDGVTYTFYADTDGDGFGDENNPIAACNAPTGYVENDDDCDDSDPLQYPNAAEYCNQEDDDCDGNIDENPVDSPIWYYDIDGDGYGSSFITSRECDIPPGYVTTDNDCDDTNTSIYPGAPEYCNDLDNDCNGQIDDNAIDALYWYADFDRDDFGDPNNSLYQCDQPFDYVLQQQDCDDSNDDINPNAIELCNTIDDNCDGIVDNDTIDSLNYYQDSDNDGFGDPNSIIVSCLQPAGYLLDDNDCDDTSADIYPDAPELCDGIDQNCNGNNFYELDLDSNGYLACEESVWFRNSSSNSTNPNGNYSQATSYLVASNITIQQYYHGNNSVTSSLLQDYGLYVHHGTNSNGAIGAYTNAEAYALQEWVYNGGRFLYIGHQNNQLCDIADSLPSQFGLTCNNSNTSWSGSTNIFNSHPITNGLSLVGGAGGENWLINTPAEILATINGYPFIIAAEYGAGKVVVVANGWPFTNPSGGYRIDYGDNDQLVQNIWTWLLE